MGNGKEGMYNFFTKCTFVHDRTATPEWGFNHARIAHHNLLLVYGGSGIFANGGERRRVERGDLVFFRRGVQQYMETDSRDLLRLYTVNFQCVLPEEANGEWSLREAELPFAFVTKVRDEDVFHRLSLLFERLCRIHLANTASREAEERAVFAQILELAYFCSRQPGMRCNYRVKSKIDETVRYMAEHCTQRLSLAGLAEYAGLSASHFSAMFKKITGYSPIDYLIRLRVTKAKRLLEDGRKAAEVAEETGFADIYYFSNTFKKVEGLSPTQYLHELRRSDKNREVSSEVQRKPGVEIQ